MWKRPDVSSTVARLKKIQEFLDEKSLFQAQGKLPYWRRLAHFWVLVIKSFQKNRGPVRAASLAYTTILSLVPVLAVIVSISTGFLQKDQGQTINNLVDRFVTTIAPQLNLMPNTLEVETVGGRNEAVQRIQSYIERVNSGTLGLTAGILLVFIAIMVLSTVEATFNDMWGVTRGRTWAARIVQYWAAITLGPLFLVTAMALTTSTQIGGTTPEGDLVSTTNDIKLTTNLVLLEKVTNATPGTTNLAAVKTEVKVEGKNFFGRTADFFSGMKVLSTLLSFLVLSTFLTLVYRLMPATKVRWDAAAVGGLVGGGLLQLNNLFNVIYISRVLTYSKIYGGLGAVPIFLLGLYFSWLIVLLGAQVAYAYQNRQAYVLEKQAEAINQRGREFVALRLMAHIAHAFYHGEKPPSRLQMASALGIPSQLAAQVLCALVNVKLLVEVNGEETGYAPARPIDKITVEDILTALRVGQGAELETAEDSSRAILREEYERVVLAEMHAAGAVTLQNLVLRLANLPPSSQPESQREPAAVAAA